MSPAKGCGRYYGKSPWDEQAVLVMKYMWETGQTATEIALALGELGYSISRNSVMGKVFRMNIKQPPKAVSPKAKRNQPRKRIIVPATSPLALRFAKKPLSKKKETKLPTFIPTRTLDPNNPGIQIIELTSEKCHAIIKDGNRFQLATYCGNPTELGKSFCSAHAAIYYRAPDHRVRR
jgi:hypothetical protein